MIHSVKAQKFECNFCTYSTIQETVDKINEQMQLHYSSTHQITQDKLRYIMRDEPVPERAEPPVRCTRQHIADQVDKPF